MRVALIGNMNNNYFALMRYMRDMGVDAELLMYEGEGAHFAPENDTWEIEKWRPYIKQTKLNCGLSQFFTLPAKKIRKVFDGYDYYIGCGFTPAYFYKAGLQLDLFTPYCVGIEYTYRITKSTPVHYIKEKIEGYYQIQGLKNNTKLVGTIDEESRVKAYMIGAPTEPLPMLMIYNKEQHTTADTAINEIIKQFKQYYPVVFSHVSHYPKGSKTNNIKRNDILINGFAKFVKQNKHNPLLVLLEYGEGIQQSKQLIRELDIENRVMWLPLISRKNIMQLLQHVHFGGGEFGGAVWGGTGWEFMAQGVPFFQRVDMSNEEFERKTKLKTPNFFNVKDSQTLANVLDKYANDRDASKQVGDSLKNWFDKNGGQDLAVKYVNLCVK